MGFACQVNLTKLNFGMMDVSDDVPWNHGEVSSICHYLFAGKKSWLRDVEMNQSLKPASLDG